MDIFLFLLIYYKNYGYTSITSSVAAQKRLKFQIDINDICISGDTFKYFSLRQKEAEKLF